MIQTTRRKFFSMVGAGAAAAPVAAQEVASAMGLSNGLLGASAVSNIPAGMLAGAPKSSIGLFDAAAEVARITKNIAKLCSNEARDQARRDARGSAVVLDPDIAAMRSISPAEARRRQVERNIDRRIETEKGWMEREIASLLGKE